MRSSSLRAPADNIRVAPKIVARVLLTLGFLAASVAYSSWTAERTILDPAATRGATHALLATPAVHDMLAREIRTALEAEPRPERSTTRS